MTDIDEAKLISDLHHKSKFEFQTFFKIFEEKNSNFLVSMV